MITRLERLLSDLEDIPGDIAILKLKEIVDENCEDEEELFLPENINAAAEIIRHAISLDTVKVTKVKGSRGASRSSRKKYDFSKLELDL